MSGERYRFTWASSFAMLWDIDLIFGMWVYNDKLQIKFTFCSGPMILWPLDFEIWPNIQLSPLFSSPDPKGHVSYCHHWASVVCRPSSVVRPLTFHILINSSKATGPIWTKLWWNGPWMAPFQNCVRWSRLPTKMAAKLKIKKRGDEILIVHCCFSISQNELKF